MAKGKKKSGSAKRYGPRYGGPIRQKVSMIEAKQKKTYVCPLCRKLSVKRVSVGIWYCEKCNTKFAGGAYSFNE
ncbi:50S ribosomal protein L37ae [archaeon]|jgi:large subunit ribosomal protein L37Ae|nr:50S ribosomal protein L37ae [archaeon]